MIYASLIGVILFHILLFRRRGLLDPVSVFFLAFLYYGYFTPVTMLLFGQYDVSLLGQINFIDENTITKSAIIFFIGYVAYGSTYYTLSKKDNFDGYAVGNHRMEYIWSNNYSRMLALSIAGILAIILIFFRDDLA
ncbi:MAG: hypothetical protein ACKOUM_08960, partial [Sphingopyxis sp.]